MTFFFFVVSVTLVIDAPLDYEVSPIHYLTLETSNGRFSVGNTLTLVINVTDVNDNAPVFGQGGYSAEITEDLTPGALVMKVRVFVVSNPETFHLACRVTQKAIKEQLNMKAIT